MFYCEINVSVAQHPIPASPSVPARQNGGSAYAVPTASTPGSAPCIYRAPLLSSTFSLNSGQTEAQVMYRNSGSSLLRNADRAQPRAVVPAPAPEHPGDGRLRPPQDLSRRDWL